MIEMKEGVVHLDLFSGIGGFALTADRVFGNNAIVPQVAEEIMRAIAGTTGNLFAGSVK